MVEGVLGPVDPSRAAVDERDVRAGGLKVEEAFRLDLREPLGFPGLREIAAGEGRSLATVVPTAKRGDQNRLSQRWPGDDAEFFSDRSSLRSAAKTASQ